MVSLKLSECSTIDQSITVAFIPAKCRSRQTYGKALLDSTLEHVLNTVLTLIIQLVELKNGVTFNGHLVECDNFMNVTLREVYQTSSDGDKFWKMKEMFIKGNIVSSFVMPIGL